FTESTVYQTIVDTGDFFESGQPIYHGIKHSSSTPPIRLMSSSTIKKGETYTASVWIKSNSVAGTSANANILIYDMPSQASLASSSRIPNSNQWARLSATYTNDTGSDLEQITAYFYLNRNPGE